ncbi:hypothetical protein GCM10010112_93020 [Actinoplanes lobatus]|uniref:Uncharacterized protein n=1 Tax=Actinoplanes lobatus TaxID=113568 RepID=A0A7W7HR49_9ACTN|nr:hypothetical protein [Actinoplanes lobatus]MBB4755112.1 hypothetical protein [Actinoplanes lobatus]GGN99313.1 hypothetical protein GCM10010112_93020 [Actinoplanes lobatus]GIE40573.1 hypothetical protein Alo02nite_34710 [Actinoplanes lobatus]
MTATTTGTYKAVYRGNTKRKRATAADTLTVSDDLDPSSARCASCWNATRPG